MTRGKLTMLATALAASAALVAGCSQSTTTSWKNDDSSFAQTDKTMYLFFSEVAVWYQPDQKTWYWYEDGDWFKSRVVPQVVARNNFRPKIVELQSPTTFEQQAVVFAGFNRYQVDGPKQTAVTTQRRTFTTAASERDAQQQGGFATGQSDRPNN
ncbi:MAG: hypothetical protein SYC29_06670 [Planctomycetota bacterium]|nr:hypothetical protein [Planctomycetota bacterium]